MFILDTTTKSLKANLSAAVTTVNPDFTTAWADSNGTTFVGGSNDGSFNGNTDVILTSAPGSGTQRYIKFTRIYNKDTAPVTINIKIDNNGTQRIVQRVTLGSGETWTPDGTFDVNGGIKQSSTGSTPTIISISGGIYTSTPTTLTILGTSFGSGAVIVRFVFGTTTADVSATPTGNGSSVSVAVPANIYNLSTGTSGYFFVITSDGRVTNSYALSVVGMPTGGNILISGTYRIHTFTGTENFVTSTFVPTGNYEYLIVGGGGGGGNGNGGAGGGAGGLRTGTSTTLTTSTSYLVTIGAGGAAASSGSASTFANISSAGGGGGQSQGVGSKGLDGGSGGGAAGGGSGGSSSVGLGNTPSVTPSQGNNGGSGYFQNTADGGGGGGGAGGVGGNGVSNGGGIGGVGSSSNISSGSVFYAGGGGGSSYSGAFASGGNGGGGRGGNNGTAGLSGTTNTGGGGGGGISGGSGGSGIVIIRYLIA
jgi:hypothetical protein